MCRKYKNFIQNKQKNKTILINLLIQYKKVLILNKFKTVYARFLINKYDMIFLLKK